MTKNFVRELEALDHLTPSEAGTGAIKAKTCLLLGTQTTHRIQMASAGVSARVRELTMYPVVNQGHLAHLYDPEQLKSLVLHSLNKK